MDHEILEWMRLERDRRAIEDLHRHYFSLINLGQAARVHSEVFAPDAEIMVGAKVDPATGEIAKGVRIGEGGFGAGLSAIAVNTPPIATNHAMSQCLITLDGDQARSETSVNSYLVIEGEPRRILVRGIRYLDQLDRLDCGWRITRRLPSHDWMFEADAAFALAHAERLQLRHLDA